MSKFTSIEAAKAHIVARIADVTVELNNKRDELGSFTQADMQAANEKLNAAIDAPAQDAVAAITSITDRDWALVSVRQARNEIASYEVTLASHLILAKDVRRGEKLVSPAGFAPDSGVYNIAD